MKKQNLYLTVLLSFILNACFLPSNPFKHVHHDDGYVIKDNFLRNNFGWIEEKTVSHDLYIKNGYYFIHSKDTSFQYSSTAPLDKSFLMGLNSFEVESAFRLVSRSPGQTQYGFFLVSGILRYDFIIDGEGNGLVYESNGSTGETRLMVEEPIPGFESDAVHKIKVKVSDYAFSFYAGETLLGEGKLNSGSWQDIRLLVSSGTGLMVSFFGIKRI
ncbi:hypothetical protein [Marinilabilia rubra]|uniref:Lipoprotein n=1 Tax=Marinilabilia rubra TaxID=2162893 RepID=A0A2U2B755_9BACT|nr:hypothetical protein [Marinilabilia rubra]PWD98898.1 hypothetical protein DDZ16_12930 [Marinilabilia rubra]